MIYAGSLLADTRADPYTHRMIEGECTCDVSDGIEFCQHCVAVALHLQEKQAPAKSIDRRGALRQIRPHLSALSQEELLHEFLETIKQDRALRDDMLQKARLLPEAMSYSELNGMIDAVAIDEHLYELREIRAYFEGLDSILVRLREFADKLEPLVLRRIAEHAIRRLNIDLELIDYAYDFAEQSIDMLIDLHRLAMGRLNWTAAEVAAYLADCDAAGQWHPFGSLAVLYCEDFGADFRESAVAEIESRLRSINRNGTAGVDQGQMRELLKELMENE